MAATNLQIAVLIADEDDIDAVIEAAIATMTDAAVFSLLTAPQDVPVTLSIPSTSSVIEAAIETAIDAAIEAAIASAAADPPAPDAPPPDAPPPKGVFPASYSEEAWQGASA